jgi:hypothetical protein
MPKWEAFDVLKAVLASLDKNTRLPTSTAALHAAICDLAENPKYEHFLREYRFSRRRYFPYSRTLEIDLTNIERSQLLSATNPNLDEYALPDKLRANFESRTEGLFTKEEHGVLKEMAQEFLGLARKYAKDYSCSPA